jgi:hypothetical protein
MIKKLAGIFVMVAGLAGFAGTADAHYVYTFSGWLYHSFGCAFELKSVQNPDKTFAIVECAAGTDAAPLLVESLCINPNDHSVNPGSSAVQTRLIGYVHLTVQM